MNGSPTVVQFLVEDVRITSIRLFFFVNLLWCSCVSSAPLLLWITLASNPFNSSRALEIKSYPAKFKRPFFLTKVCHMKFDGCRPHVFLWAGATFLTSSSFGTQTVKSADYLGSSMMALPTTIIRTMLIIYRLARASRTGKTLSSRTNLYHKVIKILV